MDKVSRPACDSQKEFSRLVEERGPGMSTEAREEILGRIREALAVEVLDPAASYARIARKYRTSEGLSAEACVKHFLDRLADYDTEILHAANEGEIAAAVAQALQHAGEHSLLVARELPAAWIPAGVDVRRDEG